MPEENNDNNYNKLFLFIHENNLSNYLSNWKEENFLHQLVYDLNYKKTAFSVIQTYDDTKIKSLNKNLLKDILSSMDIDNIDQIKFTLKYYPYDLNLLLQKYTSVKQLKTLRKALQEIKLKEKIKITTFENNQNFEISGYYTFRINKYFPSHIDILVEYIKNQKEFNIFIPIL